MSARRKLLAFSAGVEAATPQAVQGMLFYNAGLAIYLAWLGTGGHLGGPMLWPAALVHAAVAMLLATPPRVTRIPAAPR
jgi:hypothetical protein